MITEPELTGLPDQSSSSFTLFNGYNYNNHLTNNNNNNNSVSTSAQVNFNYRHEYLEEDPADEFDFSDAVLTYISEMLMEDNIDDKVCMLQESLDLQAAERSLYEAIGKKYPPSPEPYLDHVVPGIKPLSSSFVLDFSNPQSVPQSSNRGRKNREEEIVVEEERFAKLPAVFPETILKSEVVDKILVHVPGEESMKEFDALREVLKKGVERKKVALTQRRGKGRGRGRGRGRGGEVVDLRSLLINCAQAVAADDRRCADQLLKQIRQHSSPFGDGNQRLAHCFGNGLEARLAGSGSQIYKRIVSKPIPAVSVLKAHQLFLACCPFRKLSYFITNKTIHDLVGDAPRVHIIDFGILYGFQWPTLIHRFSISGSPKVRITGIEFPQPGFRPAQRVEETGIRLAAYAKQFGVPFEYKAIAKKWDAIRLEDLDIDREEVTVVNCMYRAENLHDESVKVESCRDAVLNLIGKINPDLFIFGIVNGAYNAPFFVTRFREALFHFSSIFDMLETIVPREDEERMFLETEVFGREALNVIACEGWERVERPETYKQWHVRAMRSGLVQVPFDPIIMKMSLQKVNTFYHKDFVVDQDNRWLLQGWKGRTVMALSVWKPDSKA